MPPIVAAVTAVVGAIGSVVSAVSAFVTAVAGWTVAGVAVGKALLSAAANLALNALFAAKPRNIDQRQASILEMQLGEQPRRALFGRVCTGGSLSNAWNDGNDYEFETQVIILADHECDAIEGFFIGDRYYTLSTQGAQAHADFQDGSSRLWIEWRLGAPGQTLPSIISTQGVAAGEYLATDKFAGLTYVVARYKVSDKVWQTGRPSFRWVVRGLKCYDPRKDSTVFGGSGSHRWDDPTTYEWSENARICHANYIWGVWNYAADPPQLMVGPGKSFEEAPAEDVIADANLCDENVSLKAGGSEKRYRVSAVIGADERWIDVEEDFALAMGGQLVTRAGSLGVDPGAAKTISFEFSDADLLTGLGVEYQRFVGRDDLINTVIARYVSPDQLWQPAAAPIRRSLDDIAADGEPREAVVDLVYVTSATQAQRIAEIRRRRARLQPRAVVPLGAAYMALEEGDWGTWHSDRRFDGAAADFEVHGVTHDSEGRTQLILTQIASSVFAWNPAEDELDPLNPAYLPSGDLPAAELSGFAASATSVSSGGKSIPAIKTEWDVPLDTSISGILVEWRVKGDSEVFRFIHAEPRDGEAMISGGLLGSTEYEVRLTPRTSPRRAETATDWEEVEIGALNIAEPGADGQNVARVRIYQRAASSPSLPSATATFTFATGAVTGLNNGWSASVPAANGNPLWIAEATAMSASSTDTIASGEWASPVLIDGAGLNSATVFLYQRAASAPSLPGSSLTYTFSTGVLSGTLGSWSQTIPAGASPLYVTTATALSAAATDVIAPGEWATARVLAQNGADSTSYWLVVDAAVLTLSGGAYMPSSLAIQAKSQTGAAAAAAYAGRFIIAESSDGMNFANVYTSASNESAKTHTPGASIKAVRVRLYQAGGVTNMLDEFVIPVVVSTAGSSGAGTFSGADITTSDLTLATIDAHIASGSIQCTIALDLSSVVVTGDPGVDARLRLTLTEQLQSGGAETTRGFSICNITPAGAFATGAPPPIIVTTSLTGAVRFRLKARLITLGGGATALDDLAGGVVIQNV